VLITKAAMHAVGGGAGLNDASTNNAFRTTSLVEIMAE